MLKRANRGIARRFTAADIGGTGRGHRSGAAVTAALVAGLLAGCSTASAHPAGTAALAAGPGLGSQRTAPSGRAVTLTRSIQQVMRVAAIPGAIVGVWQRGRAPYVHTFGVSSTAPRKPMSTAMFMRIGSETKTFTITALLQLVDRRKVGLSQPIARYISGVPDGNVITISELAEMRSGLYNYSDDSAMARAFLHDPYRQWKPQELLRYSFSHPLLFRPGTQYRYSNTNTILLGLVIEKQSGQSLAGYIGRHVLAPDHLAHSSFPRGAEFPFPHARGHTYPNPAGRTANPTRWNPSWGWAAGAMISTLSDLHAWARDVATGRLLTPATQRRREHFIPIPGLAGAGYGLGLFDVNGWIGHNGSLPGYQSLAIYLPSQRATVVVLVNSDVSYRGEGLTTLIGQAITKIISPGHIFVFQPRP
jgi:D-alanyl-D-alanine carboxypeptidase